jgi:hypothetical protein
VVSIYTACFKLLKLFFSSDRVYSCVSYGSHNKQRLFLNNINPVAFVAEMSDVSCEVWTERLFVLCRRNSGPPLWSSGQSSWLQIQRSGFDYRRYQILWVVGLERDTLSLVSTTEELLVRKSNGIGLEIREYGRRDPLRWPCDTLYPQKVAATSPTSGGRSVAIVRSRTKTTDFLEEIQSLKR